MSSAAWDAYEAAAARIRKAGGEIQRSSRGGQWRSPDGSVVLHTNTVRALARRLYLKPLESRFYGRELVVRYGLAD